MDLLVTHPVKKSDLGFHGNLFGGKLLSWIDAAIAAYAMETCHTNSMITVSLDKCIFKRPAKEGNLVKIYAKVIKIGDTSAILLLSLEQSFTVIYSCTFGFTIVSIWSVLD